jgi:hypothetical protein
MVFDPEDWETLKHRTPKSQIGSEKIQQEPHRRSTDGDAYMTPPTSPTGIVDSAKPVLAGWSVRLRSEKSRRGAIPDLGPVIRPVGLATFGCEIA